MTVMEQQQHNAQDLKIMMTLAAATAMDDNGWESDEEGRRKKRKNAAISTHTHTDDKDQDQDDSEWRSGLSEGASEEGADGEVRKSSRTRHEDDEEDGEDYEDDDDDDVDVNDEHKSLQNRIQHREFNRELFSLLRDALSPEQIDAEIKAIHGMWEMAAILDFFHLFRHQLKTRPFSAPELERVLVTSTGDEGLLADVHIDLMRGISPKNEITKSNWQVHLANKIKFHWRALSDATPCPFKPEKYLEAVTYAELRAQLRVKALHFLCCIRADREDVRWRVEEAEREKTEEEVKAAEAALEVVRQRQQRPIRSSRVDSAFGGNGFGSMDELLPHEAAVFESVESFRREPTGVDGAGNAYYYFDQSETTGFRLYKELCGSDAGGGGGTVEREREGGGGANKGDKGSDDEQRTQEDNGGGGEEAEMKAREEKEKAVAESKMGKKRRERALKKMPLPKPVFALRPPPRPFAWQLVASTVEEVEQVGKELAQKSAATGGGSGGGGSGGGRGATARTRTAAAADAALSTLLLEEVLPQLKEKAEAEERKRRATERVRSRLGFGAGQDGGGGGGGGGGGEEDGFGGASGLRPRRSRLPVNYAFTDYDDMLRSAIRRSQRQDGSPSGWGEDGEWGAMGGGGSGAGRSRRSGRGHSPVYYTNEEAQLLGLRRGRSTAGLHGSEEGGGGGWPRCEGRSGRGGDGRQRTCPGLGGILGG